MDRLVAHADAHTVRESRRIITSVFVFESGKAFVSLRRALLGSAGAFTLMNISPIGRRTFIKSMLAAGVAPMVVPSRLFGQQAPSKRITLGFIGMGGQGVEANLTAFLGQEDCRAVAVCDVFRSKTNAAADLVNQRYSDQGCRRTQDFREIIADPSIDAVVISTPDHWHVPMTVMALAAGKHVFCEKPTYTLAEGRAQAEAVKRSGKVFQGGIEDRSLMHYHRMVEWVRNGAIGDLYHVDVTLPAGMIYPWEPETPVPADLNWKLWLGPAPYHHYTATRTAPMHWRFIRDYSTGMLTDWGSHLVDTAQLAINDPQGCASEVRGWGEPLKEKAQSDIPAIYDVHYRYSNGITMRVRNAENEEWLGSKAALRFQGSKGWVSITGWRGQFAASDPKILQTKYDPAVSKFGYRPPAEQRDFLDCVRSGAKPAYDAETLHQLCTTLHMGLISLDLGRKLEWDHAKQEFRNDAEANRRTERVLNKDWESA